MAVYRYTGVIKNGEEILESGTVLASTEDEARTKLKALKFRELKLKRLSGLSSFVKQFTADIR